MTKPSQSGFKRFFYNQNIKRDKSGKKYKNLIDHAIILTKRVQKEGMNTWLANAISRAKSKIEAYGIALYQFESALQHKKLDHLTELFHQTFGNAKKTTSKTSTPITKKEVAKKETKTVEKMTEEKKAPAKKIVDAKVVKEKTPVSKKTTAQKIEKKISDKKPTEKKAPTKKPTTKAKTSK